MELVDWLILLLPALATVYIGWRTHHLSRGVSGFLTGGRVAGRYVVAVASGEAAMGLISVIALFEKYYQSGFAIGFWQKLGTPVFLLMTLTGFVIYRYRETRVMTLAQFFEVRYSKRFRIFAGLLAFISGVLNYAIFPAVGARFFIYYTGLPDAIDLAGYTLPLYPLVMAAFLGAALLIVMAGGQLVVMVTDCVQGIFSYLGYALVAIAVFWFFSFDHFAEAMAARPSGRSFINPFDTADLTDFNLLFVFIGIAAAVYNRMSWQGAQGYNAAAINAHEQKMAGVLGTWRGGFQTLMIMLLAIAAYTFMHHPDFTAQAAAVQTELSHRVGGATDATAQTLSKQMVVPVAIREFLPAGIVGVFLAVMIFWMVSTDTTYLHSWGSILVQDVILPFRRRPFAEKTQLLLLRLAMVGVTLFAYFFSLLYAQTTYILMYMALTGAIYVGGAGAVIIGGMYWSRGTAAGAWAGMLVGVTCAALGFFLTHSWESIMYPVLASEYPAILEALSTGLATLGQLLPIANWEVGPARFPISGQEILLLTIVSSVASYVLVSLATCREPFNLDRMLHRGPYARADEDTGTLRVAAEHRRGVLQKFLGFNEHYTKGDRVLTWAVFYFTMFHLGVFLVAVVSNLLGGVWSDRTWFLYWKYYTVGLSFLVGAVTTVWFTIGGTMDLRRLLQRLRALKVNTADDGRVIDHMNADDYEAMHRRQPDTKP